MDLQAETLVRKREYVGAHRVTEENMAEIAKWCGGRINTIPQRVDRESRRYIRMPAPFIGRGRAYAGDWVLNIGGRVRAYTDTRLWEVYERPTPIADRSTYRNDKHDGEVLYSPPAKHNNVAHRIFGDATYNPATDSLELLEPSLFIPAKEAAKKIYAMFQEEQKRIDFEAMTKALLEAGAGVFENYTLEYYLDGKKIGKDLPEGHNCFEKSCVVEEMIDIFDNHKKFIKIYHRHLTDIGEDEEDTMICERHGVSLHLHECEGIDF